MSAWYCGLSNAAGTSRPTRRTVLVNLLTLAIVRYSHPFFGGRDARKEDAFHHPETNLRRRGYTPIPLYVPVMGDPSMLLKSIQLSRGGTGLLDVETGPVIPILMQGRKTS